MTLKIEELFKNGSDELEIVDSHDWQPDPNYNYRKTIIKYEDKHYLVTQFSYRDAVIREVKPVENTVTKIEWHAVGEE
jgi:hypothetical protein